MAPWDPPLDPPLAVADLELPEGRIHMRRNARKAGGGGGGGGLNHAHFCADKLHLCGPDS